MTEQGHRTHHSFGQIPTYEEGDLLLFESDAIVLHIAQPRGVTTGRRCEWNTGLLEKNESWYEPRLPMVEERIGVQQRGEPDVRLGDA
jgi:glutathione S-transferase